MIRKSMLLALTLVLTAAVPAVAPGHGQAGAASSNADAHPACLPNRAVVDNEDVRIGFHGAKFKIQVFKKNSTTGGNDGMYQYKSLGIDELGEDNETLASLNLGNAEPKDSTCTIEENRNWVNVTWTATEPVRTPGEGDGPTVGDATVELVYHFNKTDDSAKFDLNVTSWPWQSDNSELDYEFEVESEWVIEPAENGLGFRDEDTGEPEAFITWAPNATATYEDDHEEEAIVDANTTGSDHRTTTSLRFTNVTAGYVELDYDPTVAVGAYIIVADLLVPLADLPSPVRRLVQDLV